MHHILGNIVDEREIDRTVNHKPNIADWVKEHMVFYYDMQKPVDTYSQNFNDWRSHPSANADVIITSTSFVITRFDNKMRYIIVTIEWCMEHGIVPPIHARRSVDGTMILLHEDFVAPVLGDEEISSYLYDSNELSEILNSEVWTEMN